MKGYLQVFILSMESGAVVECRVFGEDSAHGLGLAQAMAQEHFSGQVWDSCAAPVGPLETALGQGIRLLMAPGRKRPPVSYYALKCEATGTGHMLAIIGGCGDLIERRDMTKEGAAGFIMKGPGHDQQDSTGSPAPIPRLRRSGRIGNHRHGISGRQSGAAIGPGRGPACQITGRGKFS